jgi:anti-sigma B factor antagonist
MRDASPGRLQLTVDHPDGVTVIRAAGEVDMHSADVLAAALRSAGESEAAVILDLIGVPFMDSSGLKVLMVAVNRMGARLVLAMSPGSPVGRLLELSGVEDRFELEPTVEDAIRLHAGG